MTSPVLYVHDELVHNKQAARIVLPRVLQFVNPSSVLDIGCGLGTWLSVCQEAGIRDYLGVDGEYVDRSRLTIPLSNFKAQDLRLSFDLGRKFDLILCLEVAEHIPETAATSLVESIARHGDAILFSAALPGQGGQHHLNEQWPDYWQKKFEQHGFYYHDIIRPHLWKDDNIQWWYRQNIFLLLKGKPTVEIFPTSAIHPALFALAQKNKEEMLQSLRQGRQGMKLAFEIFFNSLVYKIRRFFRL